MASGLSMPVGFKNCTDGDLSTAINAMIAAASPQHFLGIDPDGQTCIVKTTGNPYAHIVLRGGSRPNYDTVSVNEAKAMLAAKGLTKAILVDCSHDNSRKNHTLQGSVWQDVINQRIDGNDSMIGMMLESNLKAGNQKNTGNLETIAIWRLHHRCLHRLGDHRAADPFRPMSQLGSIGASGVNGRYKVA